MKRAGGGFDAGYNAQLAVDEAAHIIVAAELTNVASDAAELPRMIDAVQANLGQAPGVAVRLQADPVQIEKPRLRASSARPRWR